MSTPILICAGISVLLLIFELAQIVSRLYDIHDDISELRKDLVLRGKLSHFFKKENKPTKQREYWRDQNGFKHWRKKNA